MKRKGDTDPELPKQPSVSVIVVTYNSASCIRQCIESLRKTEFPDWELILVDNNSQDHTVDLVRSVLPVNPRTILVEKARNLGLAGAFNVGYELANGDVAVFLAPDTMVDPTWLDELIKVFSGDMRIGAAQPKLLRMDDPDLVDTVGQPIDSLGFGYPTGGTKDTYSPKEVSDIFYADGAALAVRRQAVDFASLRGKPFDDQYFLFYEETDLCWRLRLSGARVVLVPQSRVYHARGTKNWLSKPPSFTFHHSKNRIVTLVRNYGSTNLMIWFPLLVLFDIARFTAFIQVRKKGHAIAILHAYLYVLRNLHMILGMRIFVQRRIRQVSDQTVVALMKRPHLARLHRNLSLYSLKETP